MLHWLTFAVPLATFVVVSGILRPAKAARLLLVGVATTLASAALVSVAPGSSHVRYGAPLAFARAGLDPLSGDPSTALAVLRTCLVADLLFWCSSAVLLGALVQAIAGARLGGAEPGSPEPVSRRPARRRRRRSHRPLRWLRWPA
jgi:hypothetical protein